jgi:HSP20 family protein
MDRLFDESLVQPSWTALARRPEMGDGAWRLPLDVFATPVEFLITASVPGVNPENVEITFEGDVLSIRGEFPTALENVEYLMRERRHGRFSRSLSFNVPVNPDAIEATFEHGVLTISVPKAEEVKSKTIKIVAK